MGNGNSWTTRLEAAAYEITQAKAEAERVAVDKRHTVYRRGIASAMASLGYAILVLIDKWVDLAAQLYGREGGENGS